MVKAIMQNSWGVELNICIFSTSECWYMGRIKLRWNGRRFWTYILQSLEPWHNTSVCWSWMFTTGFSISSAVIILSTSAGEVKPQWSQEAWSTKRGLRTEAPNCIIWDGSNKALSSFFIDKPMISSSNSIPNSNYFPQCLEFTSKTSSHGLLEALGLPNSNTKCCMSAWVKAPFFSSVEAHFSGPSAWQQPMVGSICYKEYCPNWAMLFLSKKMNSKHFPFRVTRGNFTREQLHPGQLHLGATWPPGATSPRATSPGENSPGQLHAGHLHPETSSSGATSLGQLHLKGLFDWQQNIM